MTMTISFIPLFIKNMARHCKDCPDKNKEIIERAEEEVVVEKQPKQKVFFFPNKWVKIEADTYEEALKILSNNKE